MILALACLSNAGNLPHELCFAVVFFQLSLMPLSFGGFFLHELFCQVLDQCRTQFVVSEIACTAQKLFHYLKQEKL